MTLGELIKKYRDEHNLSQRQFAEVCGLSNGYISMIEKGENPKTKLPVTPTLPAYQKIALGMGINVASLFSYIDDTPVDIRLTLVPDNSDIPTGFSPLPETMSIPRVGGIACGTPILAEQNIETYDDVPKMWNAAETVCCHVSRTVMLSPSKKLPRLKMEK